jgi:hypothetical protein
MVAGFPPPSSAVDIRVLFGATAIATILSTDWFHKNDTSGTLITVQVDCVMCAKELIRSTDNSFNSFPNTKGQLMVNEATQLSLVCTTRWKLLSKEEVVCLNTTCLWSS